MEQVIYTVKLDLTDNGCFDSGWRIKQGDNANSYLKVKVENNGVVYFNPLNLPEIVFHRPDGSTVVSVMSAGTDDFYTYTIVGNELAVAGNVVMDVKFTDSGRTSTASCTFLCVPDTISGDPSGASTYYNPISELIEQGEQIIDETDDNRLISEGYARGTQDGEEVGPESPYYHNNAKYYMEQSSEVSNITWDRVQNKPFSTIGNNLIVDQNGALNASDGLTNLYELYDVNINGPANGQVLAYNAATQKWINSSSGGGGGLLPHLIVTTTTGSTVTATKGLTVVTLTETSTGQFETDIPEFGSWDIEASLSGSTATYTLVVDTVKIYTVSLGYFNATITVTFPANSTCSCGKTGETPQTASVSPHTFTVHSVGIYTITATDGTHTKSGTVTITTDGQSESVTLTYVPDGSTVLPTDDIQIWLNCADIYDKTYTTLSEVLADSTTLSTLIADNNAVDYMVRSKSWASNKGLVPKMTSNTTPSGVASANNYYGSGYEAYKAFDGNSSTHWSSTLRGASSGYLRYQFSSAVCVKKAYVYNGASQINTLQVEGSNNGTDWTPISEVITTQGGGEEIYIPCTNNSDFIYYQIAYSQASGLGATFYEVQFYPQSYDGVGITEDSTAMTYIGLNNYASNTLLADSDWAKAICVSNYSDSVMNVHNPNMSSNTTPSGYVASASSVYSSQFPAYQAFDGTGYSWCSDAGSSFYVRLKFAEAIIINAFKMIVNHDDVNQNRQFNNWKIQGSNDASNWTDLYTSTELTVSDVVYGGLFNNSTPYLYYQLYIIKNATTKSYSPEIEELRLYSRVNV